MQGRSDPINMTNATCDPKFYIFSNFNSDRFVYSGNSGLIIEYDEDMNDFLKNPENGDPELKQYLLEDPFIENPHGYFKNDPNVNMITVFTTNQCNLNCSYCYEKANDLHSAKSIDMETFRKGIDFFVSRYKEKGVLGIQFFGGEPLINYEFISEAVKYLKKLENTLDIKFIFSIVTNGTIFNKQVKELLVTNKFSVTISVDGTRDIHDKNRTFLNGKGSYDKVMENVKELSAYLKVTARLTITDPSMSLVKVYEELTSQGFSAVSFDIVSKSQYDDFDFDALSENMKEFAQYFLDNFKKKKLIQHQKLLHILFVIHNGMRKGVRYLPCAAGSTYFSLSVNGDIYPCHRLNNNKKFVWGNIYEGIDLKKRNAFLEKHLIFNRDNSSCTNCWAKYLCGGTCYENANVENNGDTDKNSNMYCFFTKELAKNALYVYSSLDQSETEILDRIENL
jgi:uncharacterized protein